MNETELERWLEASEQNRKLFAKETLILEVTEAIWEAMKQRGYTKAKLAEALGTSKANVTQLLDGSRNMTLSTLSDIAFVLELKAKVRICDKHEPEQWEHVEGVVTRPAIVYKPAAANEQWTELEEAKAA